MHTLEKFYLILGIQPGATAAEVKQAYRDLVRIWHPDRLQHDPRLERRANEQLALINEAYKVISSAIASEVPPKVEKGQSPGANRPSASQARPSEVRDTSTPFITDLRDGETVEIVDLHPEDGYYEKRLRLIGSAILVKNPIHKGKGWYCTHGYFRPGGTIELRQRDNEGVLFGYVRVRRLSQGQTAR